MPAKDKLSVTIDFEPMKGFGGGFRQEWVSGEDEDGNKFGLDSGAGLGNAAMTFWTEPKGQKRTYYTASVGKLLQMLAALSETA